MAVFGLAGLLRIRRLKEERAAYEMVRARSRASELASERHQLLDQLDDHAHEARDVRAVEKLEEKHVEEEREIELRGEQTILDELASRARLRLQRETPQ